MFGLFTTRITSRDVARAITFADSFAVQQGNAIPSDVLEAWRALRGALLAWKDRLAAQEDRTP
jgi:hypothetical protein